MNARDLKEAQAGAATLSLALLPVEIGAPDELEGAFAAAKRDRVGAILVLSSPITFLNRPKVAGAGSRSGCPPSVPYGSMRMGRVSLTCSGWRLPTSTRS